MDNTPPFSIKTSGFEGPLELLLDLIEQRRLLINDISLAAVTDEYMARVAAMPERISERAQFVLVAATLLLLKSKSLLPALELTQDESQGIDDLEARLALYKIFRDAGADIRAAFGTHILYKRPFAPITEQLFLPDSFTTLSALGEAVARVLTNLPKTEPEKPQVAVQKVISLEEMMERLSSRISEQFRVSFSVFAQGTDRAETIVSFLAVLELIKQGLIMARQESRFADFSIEREAVDTPRYL